MVLHWIRCRKCSSADSSRHCSGSFPRKRHFTTGNILLKTTGDSPCDANMRAAACVYENGEGPAEVTCARAVKGCLVRVWCAGDFLARG